MKKYNIFWFIIDSVRSYSTGKDDRDKLDIMEEFGRDSVEFTNCITSAPSSLLSAGAMFTGLPSAFISRHFNDFKITSDHILTISTLVKQSGYKSIPILDTRDLRIPFHHIVPNIKGRELPKGFKLSDYAWHNNEINKIFEHLLKSNVEHQPFVFTIWNDCRRDDKISGYVREMLDHIKGYGLYDDSIIIMNSDHGYPDPGMKITEEYFKKHTLGNHDLILTDDNIKVPLYIKYPGSPAGVKIDNCVGLIDVLPTVFDILQISCKLTNNKFKGESLLGLIENREENNRVRITDTRLPMDSNRLVSFRNNHFKYIYIQDTKDEYLFDIRTDRNEIRDIKDNPEYFDTLEYFRRYKDEYETGLFFFHEDQLILNSSVTFNKIKKRHIEKKVNALIVTSAIAPLIMLLIKSINKHLEVDKIDLLFQGETCRAIDSISRLVIVEDINPEEILKQNLTKYDFVFYLTENSSRVYLKDNIYKAVKAISAENRILINYNFEMFNYFVSKWLHSNRLKLFLDWDNKGFLYKQEPLFFIKDLAFFILWALKKIYNTYFSGNTDIDLKAAKDIMDFRKFHSVGNEMGLQKIEDKEMDLEFSRIKTRE